MLIWVLLAVGALVGVPFPALVAVGVIAVASIHGSVALVVAAAVYGWHRRRTKGSGSSEVALLRSLAGVVSGGGTLRQAVATSSSPLVTSDARRLCATGASMADIGEAMASMMTTNGRQFAAMCAMSEHTGSSVAEPLEAFADRARAAEMRDQRKRASLAQIRFSAWVVGVAPLGLTALLVAAQGIPEPGGPLVVIPMVIGALLQITGTLLVFVISGRTAT